jgi:hypothetical protein
MDSSEDDAAAQAERNALRKLQNAMARRDHYKSEDLTDLLPVYENRVVEAFREWCAAAEIRARLGYQATGHLRDRRAEPLDRQERLTPASFGAAR